MSKEREMIEKLCSFQMTYSDWLLLIADAEELLAQPEQEPVAWMLIDKETGARIPKAYKPEHGVNKDRWELYPLHTTLTKREPLSDEEIDKGYQESDGNYYDLAFRDGVRFAEKHHGIGGGE
jgi:hypothetical protein